MNYLPLLMKTEENGDQLVREQRTLCQFYSLVFFFYKLGRRTRMVSFETNLFIAEPNQHKKSLAFTSSDNFLFIIPFCTEDALSHQLRLDEEFLYPLQMHLIHVSYLFNLHCRYEYPVFTNIVLYYSIHLEIVPSSFSFYERISCLNTITHSATR